MKRLDLYTAVIFLLLDAASIAFAFYLALFLRQTEFISNYFFEGFVPTYNGFSGFIIKAIFLFLLIAAHQKLYNIRDLFNFDKSIPRVFTSIIFFAAIVLAWFFLKRVFFFSRFVLIVGTVLSLVFLCLHRLAYNLIIKQIAKNGRIQRNILFIGWNDVSKKILTSLKNDPRYNILGVLSSFSGDLPLKKLGTEKDIKKIIKNYQVNEVIHLEMTDGDDAHQILDFCHDNHIEYHLIPDLCARHLKNIEIQDFFDFPMLRFRRSRLHGWGRILKRIFDLIASGIGIIILSPVLLIIAILIKIDSKGPVFYVSKRISMGKEFTFLKFRTMYTEMCVGDKYGGSKAKELRENLLTKHNERDGTPMFKMSKDPRITKIGRILRNTSLDELPQLFNVFIGTMSLVGPRPHLPEEVEKYNRSHRKVLAIKPGITGLPQIHGRSDLHFDKEVELDTHYIENWSFWTDISILCKTFYVVLFKRGSY